MALAAAPAAHAASPGVDAAAERELRDAMALVEQHYLKPMSHAQLMDRALKATLADLDPYSMYLTPAERAAFASDLHAHFGGIGVNLDFKAAGGEPAITHLMLDSPAGRAGLGRGDRIAAIDGHLTRGATPDDVIAWLRGNPGVPVSLDVRREHEKQPVRIAIVRASIAQPSVRGAWRDEAGRPRYMLDPGKRIGYIRINRLADDTVETLAGALHDLRAAGMHGLVLDLRDCIGGRMEAALGSADLFITRGRMLTVVERGQSRHYDAKPGEYTDFPMVVLLNAGTASSGEILVGALKDSGRAMLVGQRTYGKGRVQEMLPLGEGRGMLVLSTGTFQRPSGKTIDRHDVPEGSLDAGIAPDIELVVEGKEYESWLDHASLLDSAMLLTPEEQESPAPDRVLERATAALDDAMKD